MRGSFGIYEDISSLEKKKQIRGALRGEIGLEASKFRIFGTSMNR